MKRIFAVSMATAFVLAAPLPLLAKSDCRKDIVEFDAAVKTTKAKMVDVTKAIKLRDEANKDCLAKGGSAQGDADMRQALLLIGVK